MSQFVLSYTPSNLSIDESSCCVKKGIKSIWGNLCLVRGKSQKLIGAFPLPTPQPTR
jgi:hypothetical protein